ncbi:MAG TPA: FHA domain-containing protein [Candidatus Binataceae bacterium]|nr:FHA domain-containing protein [Candidatus Binataceae bacterium]HVB82902.1 FHA domain-containing protein [Candidatus Binataceae bacterium]
MDTMTRCSHGHFYDPAKHSSCPYCGAGVDFGEGKTRRVPDRPAGAPPTPPRPAAGEPGVTRALYRDATTGINPVMGWLVCIEGPDKGRDFRIHAEKNFIGRGSTMDIAVTGDEAISRDKHAAVVFEPKRREFWVMPGEAAGLVYLNEQMVNAPARLKARDVIEVGKSKLLFWPFCDDKFHWD